MTSRRSLSWVHMSGPYKPLEKENMLMVTEKYFVMVLSYFSSIEEHCIRNWRTLYSGRS